MASIAVLGAGAWGTALAIHLARNNHPVILWGRDRELVVTCKQLRCNQRYLPDIPFPPQLILTSDIKQAVKDCAWLVLAVPSHSFHEVLAMIQTIVPKHTPLCWVTKGLDKQQGQLLSEIAQTILGNDWPIAVLSGPSFAQEVGLCLPTAVIIAGNNPTMLTYLQQAFHSLYFRVYLSQDMIGVQIAGVVKNVIAIATGICDGLKLGANARAGLMTRGLAEMARLGTVMGGEQKTFMGLAGMGDLVLTATDDQSRNRRFGLALAQGVDPKIAINKIGQVVEGSGNADLILHLAANHQVEMPIITAVAKIIKKQLTVKEAIAELLAREPGMESY